MKKTFRLLGMAVVAILMSAGFSACSSDNDGDDVVIPELKENTYSHNGTKMKVADATFELFDYYRTGTFRMEFTTEDGRVLFCKFTKNLLNKKIDLTKEPYVSGEYYFSFDAADADFSDDTPMDWEFVWSQEIPHVKSGSLYIREIKPMEEYEITLKYVKNGIREESFEDRTVEFHYKGKVGTTRYIFAPNGTQITGVSYNAEELKNNGVYKLNIQTDGCDWDIEFDKKHLGETIDLTQMDEDCDNPFRIQASDFSCFGGDEFLFGGPMGTLAPYFADMQTPHLFVAKVAEKLYLIDIVYSTANDYYEFGYVGDIVAK